MYETSSFAAAPAGLPGERLARGVARALAARGFAVLTEFILANGRRADVFGIGRDGGVVIVEVKSSVADFRADEKWPDYLEYCEQFFFAVPEGFPEELLPVDVGLLIADDFDAVPRREAPVMELSAARRRAVTLRFARAAAARLHRVVDPGVASEG